MHKKLALALVSIVAGSTACSDESGPSGPFVPDLVITTSADLAGGNEDQSYMAALTAEGGTGDGYRWSVLQGQLPLNVFLTSSGTPGTVISGTPRNNGRFVFTVQVEDSDGNTVSQEFTLTIDAAPPAVAIIPVELPEGATEQLYEQTIDAENGSGEGYRWSLVQGGLPPGLEFTRDGMSTDITGTPIQAGAFSFRLRVEDSKGDVDEESFTIVVQDSTPPLELRTTIIPDGQVGVIYSADPPDGGPVQLESQGGKGSARTWSIVNGELPPGVTLMVDENDQRFGLLDGVPTVRGNYSFRVRVEDEDGTRAERTYFTTIDDALPPLRIITVELPDGEVATPYEAEIEAINGAARGYRWEIIEGALPPGLMIAAEGTPTTRITGMPTAEGTYSFIVQVTDALNNMNSFLFTIRVAAEILPIGIVTTTLPDGSLGDPYLATLVAENGFGNYNWVVTEGTLPLGVNLGIPGTPSTTIDGIAGFPGTFTATITVFDLNNNTASRPYSFDVVDNADPLDVLPVTFPALDTCRAGAVEVTATEGSNFGYTWSVDPASPDPLPAGFSLDPMGTPSTTLRGFAVEGVSGTFNVLLRVEDSSGRVATESVTITINASTAGPRDRMIAMVGDMFVDNRFDIAVSNVCQNVPSTPTRASPGGTTGDADTGTLDFAVSPDGTMVAFTGDFRAVGFDEVWITDISGNTPGTPVIVSNPATTSNTLYDAFDLKWAPDSDHLVFNGDFDFNGRNELYAVDTSGVIVANSAIPIGPTPPTFADVDSHDYNFSFDGRYVAYAHDTDGSSQYEGWVYDLDSNTARSARKFSPALPSTSSDVDYPFVWSPNSYQLLFHCDCNDLFVDELFMVDVSQAMLNPQVVNHALASGEDVRWTSSESLPQLFGFTRDGNYAWYISGGFSGSASDAIFAVRTNMPGATGTLVHDRQSDINKDFFYVRPAMGSMLVAMGDADVSSQNELFLFDLAQTLPQTVSSSKISGMMQVNGDIGSWTDFEVSPDGRWVVFTADKDVEGHEAAYAVNLMTRSPATQLTPSNITDPDLDVSRVYWAPASNWVALWGDLRVNNLLEVTAVDVAGGPPYNIIEMGPNVTGNSDVNSPIIWRADGGGVVYEADLDVVFQDEAYWVDVGNPSTAVRMTNSPTNGDVFFIKRQGQFGSEPL